MMIRLLSFIVLSVCVLIGDNANAQCFGGRCFGRGYAYAPTYGSYGGCFSGRCTNNYSYNACQSVQTVTQGCFCENCNCSPCQCRQVQACGAIETVENACAPCEAVLETGQEELIEVPQPIPPCGNVQRTENKCPNGVCPIRTPIRTVVKTTLDVGYLSVVNAARVARGLTALTLDATLQSGAQRQAQNMANYGALYHASGVAENCATDFSAQGAVNQWIASPPHNANMFNPSYTKAGLGVARDRNGRCWFSLQLR